MHARSVKDALQQLAAFNSMLNADRRLRVPFLDAIGIAQCPSDLWMDASTRQQPFEKHLLYSYPARRWRRKTSLIIIDRIRQLREGKFVIQNSIMFTARPRD